jgi:hypothetical protein
VPEILKEAGVDGGKEICKKDIANLALKDE